MKKHSIIAVLLLIVITSCTFNFKNKDKYNDNDIFEYNDFKSELVLKYRQYATLVKERGQKNSYNYFTKQSQLVYSNAADEVLLNTNSSNNLIFTEDLRFKLLDYRNRLLNLAKQHNLKKVYPIKTANLFFFLDCWGYYSLKENEINQANYCQRNFMNLFITLERSLTQEEYISYEAQDKKTNLTNEEKEKFSRFDNDNLINIYFDLNSYKLNATATQDIKTFLKYLSNVMDDYKITLIGHADRTGKVLYNNELSRKRARTVYNILVKNGVPPSLISIENSGSKKPGVITNAQTINKLNRRVEIKLEKNTDLEQDYLPQPL